MRNEVEHDDQRESLILSLSEYPLSRILFITIKDNKQKWKIGKVNDWIRRYSDVYHIVKGTENGEHYHLIAGIKPNKNVVPVKGIHFHICNLQNSHIMIYPDKQDSEDKRKRLYFRHQQFLTQTVDLLDESQNTIWKIKLMIEKYFRSMKNKQKKERKLSDKEKRICNVKDYLNKNLFEPREDDILYRYVDYIYRD